VYAAGMNSFLQSTDVAETDIALDRPAVSLNISYGAQRNVTVWGHLTGLDNTAQTVHISGVIQGNALTDDSGDFSLTALASGLGTISVSETDLWGQVSNTASVNTTDDAPRIEDFAVTCTNGNVFTFTGRVIDQYAEGLLIRFGGLVSLQNLTATVEEDGTFAMTCEILALDLGGTASAVTTDWWGLDSNTVLVAVG
jgi:hypothetical protein